MFARPQRSTLFPYTTLFRSLRVALGSVRELLGRLREFRNDEVGKPGEPVLVIRSEEHTSELQSRQYLVCRLLLEKKKEPFGIRRGRTILGKVKVHGPMQKFP